MKTYLKTILFVALIGVFGFITVNGITANDGQALNTGTSFQGHRDGTYGPVGAGGYGMPDMGKTDDTETTEEKGTDLKPLFPNLREGTSFQDHSEGKYGPPGAGGYGPPDFEKTDTRDTGIKAE